MDIDIMEIMKNCLVSIEDEDIKNNVLTIPEGIISISKHALDKVTNPRKIKKIIIPSTLKIITQEFLRQLFLEEIIVDKENRIFSTTFDHKILLDNRFQEIILYAKAVKDKEYSLSDYCYSDNTIRPIESVGEYAFEGASNLDKLTLCACTKNIETNSFKNCPNLKTLVIEAIPLFTCLELRIVEKRRPYFDKFSKEELYLPFETLELSGDEFVSTFTNGFVSFKDLKNIILPEDGFYSITSNTFANCKKLKPVNIAKNIKSISNNAFPTNTIFEIGNFQSSNIKIITEYDDKTIRENVIEILNKNTDSSFEEAMSIYLTNLREMKTECNKYKNSYRLYILDDNNTYLIVKDNSILIQFTKDFIAKVCRNSKAIEADPILFLDFITTLEENDLLLPEFLDGNFISQITTNSRRTLESTLIKDDKFYLNILKNSALLTSKNVYSKYLLENYQIVVDKINLLKKYHITEESFYNLVYLACINDNVLEELLKNHYDTFLRVAKESKLDDLVNEKENIYGISNTKMIDPNFLSKQILEFIKLIEKYDIKDNYAFNKIFLLCNKDLNKKLLKYFDNNIKRLLKASKIFMTGNTKDQLQNYSDLLNIIEIIGGFSFDAQKRQQAITFLTEKMFIEPTASITSDDIHRIFNFNDIEIKYNPTFAEFFRENYYQLISIEKESSGFIERIYKNFSEIEKTSTSDKGSQRNLKVTVEKCLNYLNSHKFGDYPSKYNILAIILSKWYDKPETLNKAITIYEESLSAPRNIFTKVIRKKDQIIYDNRKENDLREEINDNYSYEWLPKQSYENFLLGKYCNCCAHIEGAGQGIMRASMILDNCQNLVIRDNTGKIISKATLYINKEEGYGVFNTVETSLSNRENSEIEKIYKAFIRGTKKLIEEYNKNNDIPLDFITIGTNRNTILSELEKNNHATTKIYNSLAYGNYSLNNWSHYNGDWASNQKLVLKK